MTKAHAQLVADLDDKSFAEAIGRMDQSMQAFALEAVREYEAIERAAKEASAEMERTFQSALQAHTAAQQKMMQTESINNRKRLDNEKAIQNLENQRNIRGASSSRTAASSRGMYQDQMLGSMKGADGGMAGANKLAYRVGQVGLQAQDVAVQLQAGTKWATIMMQQGTQIASIFGNRGAIYAGIAAITYVAVEWLKNTKEIKAVTDAMAAEAEKKQSFVQQAIAGREADRQATHILGVERTLGREQAEYLRLQYDYENKIQNLKNKGKETGTNVSEELKMAKLLYQEQIRGVDQVVAKKRMDALNDKDNALRQKKAAAADAGAGAMRAFRDASRGVKDDILEAYAKINKRIESAAVSASNASKAIKSASATFRDEVMNRFKEEIGMRRDRALFSLRGSEFQNKMAELKAEERFIKDSPAVTEQEKRRRQFELDRNQAQQSDLFHSRTFGKSQKQIRDEIRAEEKMRREEEKWSKQQRARGGLIDVQRDASGNVIGGIDPTTGKRVSGDEAKKAMDRLNRMAQRPDNQRNSISLSGDSIKAIVSGMATEVQKLVTR